jgi:hypothetical protein
MDTPRKLAAILAADIAGYSWLMGLDEAGTAKLLREHRAAIDPIFAGHGGRIFKMRKKTRIWWQKRMINCWLGLQKPEAV